MVNNLTMVNDIIRKAVSSRASDIHFEPRHDQMEVRFRIDGFLSNGTYISKMNQNSIISCIKVMVNMDIAESRLPQDGKAHLKIEGKELDLRVSTIPISHGEKAVIRILEQNTAHLPLEGLGMWERELKIYSSMTERPSGIILLTGPTGSGKTTTLYATLSKLNQEIKNITTIEDPVEYQLPGINQIQVNNKSGLNFSKGLRSILRQDPDIIMIGEIRDRETADIAIQAAMTGHLVLSTLHTNDSVSAIPRLMDMGIEPYLIAASLNGVVAQRLVRTLCSQCEGKGCQRCQHTGYHGRTGIFEIFQVSQKIREMIGKYDALAIKRYAQEEGMEILLDRGIEKTKLGITSKEEILRIIS
ncbi:MAG: GspE/PulE family protein [bacterium]